MNIIDPNVLSKDIELAAEYDYNNQKIFGAAYWVYQKNKTVYQKCFGTTGISSNIPVSETTLFRLASMTKPITTMAVLILLDRGLLKLTDPISRFIPEAQNIHIHKFAEDGRVTDYGMPKSEPTILHLLNHTAGFGIESFQRNPMTQSDKANLDATVRYWIENGLSFEPGTQQCYSAVGAFDCLAKIIEIISGQDYLSFLQQEIFWPCGMVDTTFIPTNEQWDRMIKMHDCVDACSVHRTMQKGCVFDDYPCIHFLGGAGLASTLQDYAQFAKMLLNQGKTEQKTLISSETFQLLHTPSVPKAVMPGCEQWGLGVRVVTDVRYGLLPVGSYGWSGAYGSHFWIDPENELAAVYMKNSCYDGGAGNESARVFEQAVQNALY